MLTKSGAKLLDFGLAKFGPTPVASGAPARAHAYLYPRLSPDGMKIAVSSRDEDLQSTDADFLRFAGLRSTNPLG